MQRVEGISADQQPERLLSHIVTPHWGNDPNSLSLHALVITCTGWYVTPGLSKARTPQYHPMEGGGACRAPHARLAPGKCSLGSRFSSVSLLFRGRRPARAECP